ncbi:CAAX protease [Sulfitobacter sp. EhC04]|uniref:CPBP family intramembrane glutamic endopeptidase n=1 Tax=Sulfitobacter sp. EhC04 TaxID=1849168 RepID=UPI0007F44364|nr:type II CAAX endopeptidase family protein [Sulfitobacter sp. EhC04]OAN77207.1 CAAX protease [Sulfitobacter sp. EhC04]
MTGAYSGLSSFVAPAREKSELWRFAAGLVIAFAAYMAFNQLFFGTVYQIAGNRSNALYNALVAGDTPLAMFLLLSSFACMMLSVALVVRVLHRRPFRSLIGPLPLAWTDFRAVTLMLVALSLVIAILPPWDMGGDFVPNMPFGQWLVLLPLSLLGVLVQVSAEEIVFRGYVQQQLAVRFRSPLVWMIAPSVLFALGHYLPDSSCENALAIALWAGVFGVLMADLTARSGSLGPAIALHFCNNVTAILIVSLPDNLSGLALYLTPFGMQDTQMLAAWLPVDFAMMLVFWLAARVAIRR